VIVRALVWAIALAASMASGKLVQTLAPWA
jgi:hypothetical protein